MNLAAVADMRAKFPVSTWVLIESAATISPRPSRRGRDLTDLCDRRRAGDKIPSKGGPRHHPGQTFLSSTRSTLRRTSGASLEKMDADAKKECAASGRLVHDQSPPRARGWTGSSVLSRQGGLSPRLNQTKLNELVKLWRPATPLEMRQMC